MTGSPLARANLALATGFFLSYVPASFRRGKRWTGAGTVGTLWGLLSLPFVPAGALAQTACLLLAAAVAVYVCGRAETELGVHDDPRIVFDEWVGYWVAMAFLPRDGATLAAAFVLFRLFDVWKGPFGRAVSRWPSGLGVVSDDLLAGLYANLALQAARIFLF